MHFSEGRLVLRLPPAAASRFAVVVQNAQQQFPSSSLGLFRFNSWNGAWSGPLESFIIVNAALLAIQPSSGVELERFDPDTMPLLLQGVGAL